MTNTQTNLAVRIDGANPLHHLWDNHGTWWLHATVHLPDGTAHRLRASLKTSDRDEACRKRDRFFATLEGRKGNQR